MRHCDWRKVSQTESSPHCLPSKTFFLLEKLAAKHQHKPVCKAVVKGQVGEEA